MLLLFLSFYSCLFVLFECTFARIHTLKYKSKQREAELLKEQEQIKNSLIAEKQLAEESLQKEREAREMEHKEELARKLKEQEEVHRTLQVSVTLTTHIKSQNKSQSNIS